MKSILVFNYVAIFVYAAILFSIYYRKMFKGIENRAFLRVIWLCLVSTMLDILMYWSFVLIHRFSFGLAVAHIVTYSYLFVRQFIMLTYIILIFVQTDSIFKLKKKAYRIALIAPLITLHLVILSNLFTHQLFTITPEDYYQRGPHMYVLYGIGMGYSIFGFVCLCKMRRYLGRVKWLTMTSTYIVDFLCALYQSLNADYLLEMISSAITLLLVHLIVYRPEEMFDSDTGLYTKEALRKQLSNLKLSGRSATLLVINFANAPEARNYFGDEKFCNFIKQTENQIAQIISEINGYKLYYHSAGSIQVVFSQGGVDIEKNHPELIDMWRNLMNDSYAAILDPKLCLLEFPRDFSNIDSLLQFCRFFQRYLKPGQLLLKAEEVIKDKNFRLLENISDIITKGIEDGNFEMYYQPIFDLKQKRFSSAEALIRLNDPQHGFIPPDMFIPTAESTGLIIPVGNFVLESIFKFVTIPDFMDLGLHYIELNLSVEQLLQKDLVSKINQLQAKYGTPSERINMEITESMADMHSMTGYNNVETLLKKNYSFSLDDYGTGYSNIKRAIDLPLSLVKIDKSIVDIVETPSGKSIIRNTIAMMHDVGFKIVCEGVETEQQYRILEKLDCDFIQGFYFARPMKKEEFLKFLQEKNRPAGIGNKN